LWDTSTDLRCCLIEQGVSPNLSSASASIADIPQTQRNYGSGTNPHQGVQLTNQQSTAEGAADADDVTFTSVSGNTIGAVVIYKFVSATDETQNPTILWLDTATGLPITPNGGDIIVTWDNGVNKIFRP
jgi:hypothetical protein